MIEIWRKALDAYGYPVDLRNYKNAQQFTGFFDIDIAGDRESTVAFERRFQRIAPTRIEPYLEVTYWKHSSRGPNKQTDTRWRKITEKGTSADDLWKSVQHFVSDQKRESLKKLRDTFGFTNVLATPLTFPALASPETIPMIDSRVANWVNNNFRPHSANTMCKLTPFEPPLESLKGTDTNFGSYLKWVKWCQEVSSMLTEMSAIQWRARDVEMAVFTAERSKGKLVLEPL